MKYRGIELKSGDQYENELCVGIELNEDADMEELIDSILEEIPRELDKKDQGENFVLEDVLDDFLQVRNWNITFDDSGLKLLKQIHDEVKTRFSSYGNVVVSVHLDEWFEHENGNECNNDEVEWDEFVKHLEH